MGIRASKMGHMEPKKVALLLLPIVLVGVGVGIRFGLGLGLASAGALMFIDMFVLSREKGR